MSSGQYASGWNFEDWLEEQRKEHDAADEEQVEHREPAPRLPDHHVPMAWIHPKPPSLERVRLLYKRRFVRPNGRPVFLPSYPINYPRDRENRGWDATNCLGPRGKRWPRPVHPRLICHKHNYCAFCWERKRRNSGLLAAIHHVEDPVVVKHSLSLPGERGDPVRVREARQKWVRFLKREGFDHVSCFVHTYGENPMEGPKGHLDVIASGQDCSIESILPEANPRIAKLLKPFHQRPDQGFYTPHVSAREIEAPTLKKKVNELVLAGMYAGRATLHTRRLLAGLFGDSLAPSVRLTTVTGKRRQDVERMRNHRGEIAKDWSFLDLVQICNEADEWDKAIGRATRPRGVRLKPRSLQAILDDTLWRYTYRLDYEETLRERYLT